MSAEEFAKFPYPVATGAHIKPYKIAIPEPEVDRLRLLLDSCPIADANWENSQEDGRFGVTRDWLIEAAEHWRHKYDWYVL